MSDEQSVGSAGGGKETDVGGRLPSAFGALSGIHKISAKPPDAAAETLAPPDPVTRSRPRRPPPVTTAPSTDMLQSWTGIASPSGAEPEIASVSTPGAIKRCVSFGQNEVRVLSPSGRVVPTQVQKMQEKIVLAMQNKGTTVLRSFQSLNRASRHRGKAKLDAVMTELTALLRDHSQEPFDSLETLRAFVRQHDMDSDGSISFGEFVGCLLWLREYSASLVSAMTCFTSGEFVDMCGGARARLTLRRGFSASGVEVAAEVAEALVGAFDTAKQVFTYIAYVCIRQHLYSIRLHTSV